MKTTLRYDSYLDHPIESLVREHDTTFNQHPNLLTIMALNGLFERNGITTVYRLINLDARPCDISVQWCGWKNMLGWKRIRHQLLEQDHQDDSGAGNYLKTFFSGRL